MARKVTKKLLEEMYWRADSEYCCRVGRIVAAFSFINSPQGHSYWWARHEDSNLLTEADFTFFAECARVYKQGEGK